MKRKKAILIIGGSGFLGTHLALRFRDEFKVFATFFHHYIKIPGVTSIPMDALNRDWVKKVVYAVEPDVVIYAAGKGDIEWAERNPKMAEQYHSAAPVNVLTAVEILQPRYIFISNPYVFEGNKGYYTESDNVLPDTSLGKNKLRAENYIKGKSLNYMIIRSSPLLGRGNGKNFSFFDKLRNNLSSNQKTELSTQEFHSFGTVYGLGDMLVKIVEAGVKNKILHYSGLTRMNYFDLGVAFCKRFGFDPSLIVPKAITGHTKNSVIQKFDFSLNCTEAVNLLKINPLVVEESFDLLEKNLLVRL